MNNETIRLLRNLHSQSHGSEPFLTEHLPDGFCWSCGRLQSRPANMDSSNHIASCCCGALSVSFEGPPSVHFWCHCTHCQNWFGSFDVGEVLWPAGDCNFRVLKGQEADGVFSYTENSDRHFCKVGCSKQLTGSSSRACPAICINDSN